MMVVWDSSHAAMFAVVLLLCPLVWTPESKPETKSLPTSGHFEQSVEAECDHTFQQSLPLDDWTDDEDPN